MFALFEQRVAALDGALAGAPSRATLQQAAAGAARRSPRVDSGGWVRATRRRARDTALPDGTGRAALRAPQRENPRSLPSMWVKAPRSEAGRRAGCALKRGCGALPAATQASRADVLETVGAAHRVRGRRGQKLPPPSQLPLPCLSLYRILSNSHAPLCAQGERRGDPLRPEPRRDTGAVRGAGGGCRGLQVPPDRASAPPLPRRPGSAGARLHTRLLRSVA